MNITDSASRATVRAISWAAVGVLSAAIAACGGGGTDTPTATANPTPTLTNPTTCAPFKDSFGNTVTCEEMGKLAGASLGYAEGGDAASGAGDAGADGTGADGAAIANMDLEFTDITGKTVQTKTDANGYYRINLRGMKAPLVATVKRNGNPWKSMLIDDIVRAPAKRAFYTINLTGLTDVVASEVAKKAGQNGADALTPAMVKDQKANVPAIVAALNSTIATQLTAANLDPKTFDPLATPFKPNQTGYDKVLETVTISRTSATGSTVSTAAPTNAPTITHQVFTPGPNARLEVAFDTDMKPGYGTTGSYRPTGSYWISPRVFIVDFASYQPGGSITLQARYFVSTGGVAMAQDRVVPFP